MSKVFSETALFVDLLEHRRKRDRRVMATRQWMVEIDKATP